MEEAERAAAGKLLQPCSAKTRKRGADDDQSDPHCRVYRSDRAVPVPRLRAGEQGVEARVHDRARGHAARAHDAGARSRAADPGERRRPAMVRPEGRHPGAELLRGGPRWVLAAPVLDFPRDLSTVTQFPPGAVIENSPPPVRWWWPRPASRGRL